MKTHLLIRAALVGGLFISASNPAEAVTAVLTPTKDNTIFENNGNSNGAGQFIFAGTTSIASGNSPRRALLAFDVAAAVPAGATIDSAILTLTVSRTISGDQSVSLHRLTVDWGEALSDAGGQEGGGTLALAGDATWDDNMLGTSSWATAGGDFVGGASATSLVGVEGTSPEWSGAGLVADVQGWLDTPAQNFGWIVIGNEGAQATAKQFNSREGTVSPSLEINFTPIPEPDSVMLLLLGIGVAIRRYRH